MSEPDRYPCPTCDATGRAPLPLQLQRTLDVCRALAVLNERITASSVKPRLGGPFPVKHTAVCNRLTELERLGFLRRLGRDGRVVVFEVAAPSQDHGRAPASIVDREVR